MKAFVFLVLVTLSTDSVKGARNDLLCNICLDIVTDIDSWITSDTTEDQIVDWLHMICEKLGELLSPDLVATCDLVLGSQIPNIIDGLVEQNLNPDQVCQMIGACPPSRGF